MPERPAPEGADPSVARRGQRATALHYQPGACAPRVLASGAGFVAQRIVELARESGVPVRSDPALVEALASLELGQDVPDALWTAVAETLAWAYRLDDKARRGLGGRPR